METVQFKIWRYIESATSGRERLNHIDGELIGFCKVQVDGKEKEMGVVNCTEYGVILVEKENMHRSESN